MTICVTNCLHWIGFHIVNRLIENGHEVDGIADVDSEMEEELSLMIGRNSLFTLYNGEDQVKDKEYTDMILVHGSNHRFSIKSAKTFNLGANMEDTNSINIKLPLLFGEWMPMDDNGVYVNGQYITFDSNRFQEDAIYIDDFVDCFMQWLKVPVLPETISLTKDKTLQIEKKTLEKQMYIRENSPIENQINKVKEHYKKIKV